MEYQLDFEKPVLELEEKIQQLKSTSDNPELDLKQEIGALQTKVNTLLKDIYLNLTPWQQVLISRHPERPHTLDYIENLITDFHELSGDRCFGNDQAIIAGFGYLDQQKVAVIGIEKGKKTKDKIQRNFGMANPEGYRKALRVMKLASRFQIPIITLVDTPGAFPGIGAEERGQAHAIAHNLQEMFELSSPIISIIIGEGGSGGALGLAIADKVMMMQFSVYSVISPESCASILWSDAKMAEQAANCLQLGPGKALEFGVIDSIIAEPIGGAHRDPLQAYQLFKNELKKTLEELLKIEPEQRLSSRFEKYRKMGNSTLITGQ